MSNCCRFYKRDLGLKVTEALANQILVEPIVSEKALKIGANRYVSYVVGKRFSKVQIKKAFLMVYKDLIQDVVRVNIANYKGKVKRNAKRIEYVKPGYKKAMILVKVDRDNQEFMNSIYGGKDE